MSKKIEVRYIGDGGLTAKTYTRLIPRIGEKVWIDGYCAQRVQDVMWFHDASGKLQIVEVTLAEVGE